MFRVVEVVEVCVFLTIFDVQNRDNQAGNGCFSIAMLVCQGYIRLNFLIGLTFFLTFFVMILMGDNHSQAPPTLYGKAIYFLQLFIESTEPESPIQKIRKSWKERTTTTEATEAYKTYFRSFAWSISYESYGSGYDTHGSGTHQRPNGRDATNHVRDGILGTRETCRKG